MAQDIRFTFKLINLPGIDSSFSELPYTASSNISFRTAIMEIIQKYLPHLDLSELALLTPDSDVITADDLEKTVEMIYYEFGDQFQITLRSSVNGPDLSVSRSKKETTGDLTPLEVPSPKAPSAPGSPPPPPAARPVPKPGRSPLPPSTEAPPPAVPPASSYSSTPSKNKKKKGAALDRVKSAMKEEILSSALLDQEKEESPEEEMMDEMEMSSSEISVEKEPETETESISDAKQFDKSCALDYFDVMNPEKYYPLHLTISDIAQKAAGSRENLLTGERTTRKVEDMAFKVESSLIKVRPVFPGCSVVPLEITTDLEYPEDKLTFYITPLVKDEIKDARIEFIDYQENVIGRIDCPCEVKDPRYSRVVALYGILASSVPKILTLFGFDAINELELTDVLPFLVNVFQSLSLGNFIGIAGILISVIVSIIIYYKRGDKSTRKEFQLGDIREKFRNRPKIRN